MKEGFTRETAACFTGHRDIPLQEVPAVRGTVSAALSLAYKNGFKVFFCGGARGFDTIAAQEVIRFRGDHPDVRLMIAVPCATQADLWPESDKETYYTILKDADDVITLSEFYYNGCMQYRNRYMVDHASLCLCYMIRFEGGTWYTVRYALHKGIMLTNLAMKEAAASALRENSWNYISISRSVYRNADIAHLHRFLHRGSKKRNI